MARMVAQTSEAQLKRASTQQVNALAQHAWKSSDRPAWLTALFYSEQIQPALLSVRGSLIARALNVSSSYGRDIRNGRVAPHPRHCVRRQLLFPIGTYDCRRTALEGLS